DCGKEGARAGGFEMAGSGEGWRSGGRAVIADAEVPGPRAVVTRGAAKGRGKFRILFGRDNGGQRHFAGGEKVDRCGIESRRGPARTDAIVGGDIWRGGCAGIDREGQDRKPGGDGRRPVRQENKSENGVCGRAEVRSPRTAAAQR